VITEVARWEWSLLHLKRTQDELRAFIQSDGDGNVDRDLETALEENNVVIATQEERVSMLKLALQCKGVHIPTTHPHEDGPPEGPNAQQVEHDDGAPNAQGQQPQAETQTGQTGVNTAEGIFL